MLPTSPTEYPWQGIVVLLHLPLVCVAVHYLNVAWDGQQHAVKHCPLPLQGLQVRAVEMESYQ